VTPRAVPALKHDAYQEEKIMLRKSLPPYGLACLSLLLLLLSGSRLEAQQGGRASKSSPAAPTAKPALFQPGIINIGAATTYRPAFTADGRTVLYTLEVGGGDYVILESRFRNGRWQPPQIAPFSGRYSDAEAFMWPGGNKLYFSSKRPVTPDGQPRKDYDIWTVERSLNGGWSAPQHLGGEVNTDLNELYPSVTTQGTLYFSRSGPEGSDLWHARMANGQYIAAEKLEVPINSDNRDAGVFIAPDESFIIFESNRPGGLGNNDLYISHRRNNTWAPPQNIGAPINSPANETSAVISSDGCVLYFASNRKLETAAALGAGLKYADLLARLQTPGNGLWHIYHVQTSNLTDLSPTCRSKN
jgi:Tol biopolymer transport system component